MEDAEVCPLLGSFFRVGIDSLKQIIINKMELGGQVTGGQVADKTNVLGVVGRDSDKLGPSGTGLPLWNLAACFRQSGFKDVDRTSPSVGIAKSLVVAESAGEDLDWSDA
jgi:hypothetical protein